MSFVDRTRPSLDLTAPDGSVYSALWANNAVSESKKLGIFDFPLIDGKVIQDLGGSGKTYPLTFWFEGENHDIEGDNLETAFSQRGEWTVNHPRKGNLTLQLASWSRKINSVDGANISVFETEWLEPISAQIVQSLTEITNSIRVARIETEAQLQEQFLTFAKQDTAAQKITLKQTTEKAIAIIQDNLKTIYDQIAEVASEVGSIIDGIQQTVDQEIINTKSLIGQIGAAVITPFLAINNFRARITAVSVIIDGFIDLLPSGTQPEDITTAAVVEAFLTSSINAVGEIVISSTYQTRPEIIQAIEDIESIFFQIINAVEEIQENFQNQPISNQYISFLNTYGNLSIFLGQLFAYLLRTGLSLKIEKRFTINRYRTPYEIALTEYGGPGVNDINLDLFISSNGLKNKEIMLLPPGKEVLIYV